MPQNQCRIRKVREILFSPTTDLFSDNPFDNCLPLRLQMSRTFKRNAVIVFGLAAFFYWAFMFAKHDPHLRNIIPFGTDPYDAIGSFAAIVGMMIALLSLVRAFRPYREKPPSDAQQLYLIRSQEAVVLAVLITVAADMVAMGRHPSVWVSSASRSELIVLLTSITIVALGGHWLVRNPKVQGTETGIKQRSKAVLAAVLATLALAFYPEHLIQRISTHLLTVIIGAFLLFAVMRVLLTFFVPYCRNEGLAAAQQCGRPLTGWYRWSIVVALGALIGAFIFVGEMSEGGTQLPRIRVLLVASVYVGLAVAGLLLAYALLASPLGLKAQG